MIWIHSLFFYFRHVAQFGPVEKMAFFDASGLYALNPQQEALNCIIFIFSDL